MSAASQEQARRTHAFHQSKPKEWQDRVARLALALHRPGFDDCRFCYGGECDCDWATRLTEALERYEDQSFPPPRESEDWS